ncbi:protein of unknown function [Cyanobium sp. NIES-981]|nr:protein of unknown function [Cyanobium sp. NIES-981]
MDFVFDLAADHVDSGQSPHAPREDPLRQLGSLSALADRLVAVKLAARLHNAHLLMNYIPV